MRKRSAKTIFDNVFWYAVYLAPLIGYMIYLGTYLANPNLIIDENTNIANLLKFSTFWSRTDISVYQSTNFIYTTLAGVFGAGGILPLFSVGSFLHLMSTYLVCCVLMHLVVDVVLAIPRLAHSFLDKFTKEL